LHSLPSSALVRDEFEEDLNILSVDDEKAVTTTIKVLLKQSGHSVDVLHDGQEALSRLTDRPDHYDILIVDHFMPKVLGLELLIQLPINVFKGRIIVLSAHLTQELEAQYLALGADKIMRKPFDVDELRHAVEVLGPRPRP